MIVGAHLPLRCMRDEEHTRCTHGFSLCLNILSAPLAHIVTSSADLWGDAVFAEVTVRADRISLLALAVEWQGRVRNVASQWAA